MGIKKIISSPLKRTYQTALAIARFTDCPICVDERIIEIHHGDWEGQSKGWIEANFPDLYYLWQTRPHEVLFPQGEALVNVRDRVDDFLQSDLLEDDTMLVTHDSVIRVINCMHEGIEIFWEHKLDSASLNFLS
jgi:broad specificity phosphatase PhoE